MPRTRIIEARRKPKDWSIGVFFAAGMWLIGESVWGLGTNPYWLLAVLVTSFIVDQMCTGKTSETKVYID